MTYDEVIAALKAHRGTGAWAAISAASGVRYDTVVKVASKHIASPSVHTVEKLAKALTLLGKPKRRAVKKPANRA